MASLQSAIAHADSIENCLAEMASATTNSNSVDAILSNNISLVEESGVVVQPISHKEQPKSHKELFDPTLVPTSTDASSRHRRELVVTWDRAMRLWQSAGTYTAGLLPSFDVEVARHFKVQSLSMYLLEACKELKMPAFERW